MQQKRQPIIKKNSSVVLPKVLAWNRMITQTSMLRFSLGTLFSRGYEPAVSIATGGQLTCRAVLLWCICIYTDGGTLDYEELDKWNDLVQPNLTQIRNQIHPLSLPWRSLALVTMKISGHRCLTAARTRQRSRPREMQAKEVQKTMPRQGTARKWKELSAVQRAPLSASMNTYYREPGRRGKERSAENRACLSALIKVFYKDPGQDESWLY